MKEYDFYLFDLDGTLTDPEVGIAKSIQYALNRKNIQITELSEIKKFIGPPLHLSFKKHFQLKDDEISECIAYYREYFSEKGIYENKIYPKIKDLLILLTDLNKKIFLATSKPQVFAKKILEHFKIDKYFTQITGSNLDQTMSDKTEIIKYTIDNYLKNEKKEKIIMIGDRRYDIIGAKNNNIDSLGVFYGFSLKKELEKAKPTYLIKEPEELYLSIKKSLNLK